MPTIEVLQLASFKFQRVATPGYLAMHQSTAEQATQMAVLSCPQRQFLCFQDANSPAYCRNDLSVDQSMVSDCCDFPGTTP